MSYLGKEYRIRDNEPKLTGAIRYAADLDHANLVFARLVTSPHAHARLLAIDKKDAESLPGTVAVLTADDLPRVPPSSRATLLLARDRVLFAGHPVALVLAENEQGAQDAGELVRVDYEVLAAVTDLDAALDPNSPAVWVDGLPGQSAEAAAHGAAGGPAKTQSGSANVAGRTEFKRGSLEQGFGEAELILEREFRTSAVHQCYLEPRVATVDIERDGSVNVWSSTQATFYVRDAVAATLGTSPGRVRVVGTPVGGGFGGKFLLYEPLLALASRHLGRPVRLALHRLEEMTSSTPAPATRTRVRLGVRRDGTLIALDAEQVMDSGCFPTSMTALSGLLLGSNYKIPHVRVVGLEVVTHRASAGAYRAPCAPQCAFALETLIDEAAQRLGLDPIELRLRNACDPGDPTIVGAPWPSMGMKEVLRALQQHPAWLGREQAQLQGRGVGIAVAGWPGGTEPAAAACTLEGDGSLHIHVGSVDITGTNSALALLAAETFGLAPEQVHVMSGDTSTSPFAGSSGGSKILFTVGPAVIAAAAEARQQVLELAASLLEASVDDLEIRDGKAMVKGSPDQGIALSKIAQKTMRFGSTLAPIYGHGRWAQKDRAPGFAAQLAEVSVDQETGAVKIHRLVIAQDVGKAIHPAAIRGQMAGGVMQGVGWALHEQLHYDEHGHLATATLNDYVLPHASQAPEAFETILVEVPTPLGPFGARGVGEPPVIATAAAIANAISDATGIRPAELPMTPPRLRALCAAGLRK